MTIETKIAKNGSTRYYVRDENGKLKAISKKDAQRFQRNADIMENYRKAQQNFASETESANTETKTTTDKVAELKAKAHAIRKEFDARLRNRYVMFNGKFFNTDDALDFTTFANDKYDGLYKQVDGEYVKVSEEEFNAINRIECRLESVYNAIDAEIARNAIKFETGKWYASGEYVADGEEPYKYLILKRTAKTVTIYDPEQDGWGYLEDYDPDDEIDGEFDCISRKKIQYDERGEYVDWEEDGELVRVFAKNKTEKPTNDDDNGDNGDDDKNDVEAPELSEELIDEYVVSDEAQTQALRAELYNVERAKGNFSTVINGEYVFFVGNQIVRIDAANTCGLIFSRHNGKKQFYMVATQAGRVIQGSMEAIAASKVADRYMAKETANEQGKFFRNFFDAHKLETGKFFSVTTDITYADGYEHTFERQFDYFNQAQEFVGEVKKVIGDAPTQIFIKRNQQGGALYYHRNTDGTETYTLPETLFFKIFTKDIQGRIDELNQAIADNQNYIDQLIAEHKNGFMWICESLVAARENLKKTVGYYEFIMHEDEPTNAVDETDEPKFEVGKTYYINVDGKPFTLKIEARSERMLTGTTINGTRKYHVHDTFRGEYVDTDLQDEFGNREMIWAAHEYKPLPKVKETAPHEPTTTVDTQTNAPNNSTPDKLRDSLARAMEECLLKMQEHCRKLDINAACYERELYNICSQGLRGASKIA